MLKEFLNLSLDTPLPQDGIVAISRFLESSDIVTGSSRTHQAFATNADSANMDLVEPSIDEPMSTSQEILACTVACENDLLRLETQGYLTQRPTLVVETRKEEQNGSLETTRDFAPAPTMRRPLLFLEPLLPSKITESLHQAMHGALLNIMTERDESHAHLIAASVLHVHEIEQERKRVARLTRQLEATQALVKAAQNVGGNPFFMDKTAMEENRASMRGTMTEIEKQTIQNADQEMLNLCQQLASEISAKTSASLEAIRIKESRKIERENEQAEKAALQNELKRCKELLASQEQMANEAKQEALAWKQAYEKAKNGDDTAAS